MRIFSSSIVLVRLLDPLRVLVTAILMVSLIASLSGCAEFKPPFGGTASEAPAAHNSANNPKITISPKSPGSEEAFLLVPPAIAGSGFGSREDSDVGAADINEALTLNPAQFGGFQAHHGEIHALVVEKDGRGAFSGGDDGLVRYSRLQGKSIESEVLLESSKPILALSLSPDGKKLAVSQFSLVIIYDIPSRKITNYLTRVEGRITALAWDPLEKLLALGLAEGDVFVWNLVDGPDAGEDSRKALEFYNGANTAIVGLMFHPSARALFVAERRGAISLWRLLRTEREMGLRDDSTVIDKERRAGKRTVFADLQTRIEDTWLDSEHGYIYAAVANGTVYRWKVRGLILKDQIVVGRDSVVGVAGVPFQIDREKKELQLLATAGRGQRLKLWCSFNPSSDVHSSSAQAPAVSSEEAIPSLIEQLPVISEIEQAPIVQKLAGAINEGESGSGQITGALVSQSELLSVAVNIVRSGSGSPILWMAQKTGNLMTFDPSYLKDLAVWRSRAMRCQG